MQLTVVGCGDAFGSGGRLQTCYHVAAGDSCFLIDCGATALIGLERAGLRPNRVGTIVISHLHGDHFAGLVWWLLHAQHIGRRDEPLEVIGPAGIEARFNSAAEALFPGSTGVARRFALSFREFRAGERLSAGIGAITPFAVSHPSGSLSAALRIEAAGRTLAFSGDTEWVDALVDCAADADLYIAECYAYARTVRYHTNWSTLSANLERITARRIMLTHMSHDMLENRHRIAHPRVLLAEDGLVVDV
ncbi:MAG: MBL fold metallo-hydrolase [Hyphomicrobiaceae bacterium]